MVVSVFLRMDDKFNSVQLMRCERFLTMHAFRLRLLRPWIRRGFLVCFHFTAHCVRFHTFAACFQPPFVGLASNNLTL